MYKSIFLFSFLLLFLSSCGGGDSGSSDPSGNNLVWDSENWNNANWQ